MSREGRLLALSQVMEGTSRYDAMTDVRRAAAARIPRLMERGQWRKFDERRRVSQRLTLAEQEEMRRHLDRYDRPPTPRRGSRPRGLEVIGIKKLVTSRFLMRGALKRKGVARLVFVDDKQQRHPEGSAFLISSSLLLTNHHVIKEAKQARDLKAEFDYLEDAPLHSIDSELHELDPDAFFYTNPVLDYTVVAVKERSSELAEYAELALRGWSHLIEESGKAVVGERVNIVQHPHGRPQEVTLRANKITSTVGHHIQYRARAQRLSSGSPVWSDDWNLVAVHHRGIAKDHPPRYRKRGGRSTDTPSRWIPGGGLWDGRRATEHLVRWRAFQGVRVSSICADFFQELERRRKDCEAKHDASKSKATQAALTHITDLKMECQSVHAGWAHDVGTEFSMRWGPIFQRFGDNAEAVLKEYEIAQLEFFIDMDKKYPDANAKQTPARTAAKKAAGNTRRK